jgi:hypothetical protein
VVAGSAPGAARVSIEAQGIATPTGDCIGSVGGGADGDDSVMLSAVSCSMQLSSGLQVVQQHLQLLQQGLGKLSKQYPQLLGNWQQEERKLSSTAAQLLHVEKSLASNYTCLVCMRVYLNPVACIPCGHTYCKMCLVGVLKGRCKECVQCEGMGSGATGAATPGRYKPPGASERWLHPGGVTEEGDYGAAAETNSNVGSEIELRPGSSSSSTGQHGSAVGPGLAPVAAAGGDSTAGQGMGSENGVTAGYVLVPVLDRLCSKYEVKLTALTALQSMLAARQLLKVASSPRA